jgi:cytochrome c oxidase assembly protein Cox11
MVAQRNAKNARVAVALCGVVAAMVVLVSFSVPLYRLFCAATGFGGTTQRAESDTAATSSRLVTIRFSTATAPDLPWRFKPMQDQVKVHLGEEKLVFFSAENLSDAPIIGHATFNVTPAKAGLYFDKIQCFCFNEERLDAKQRVEMPVDFFVDPGLAKDANAKDVDTITLAYTFFRSVDPNTAKDLSRFVANAPPDPERGQQLFSERCTACHALDKNKLGPMLGGVFGRESGAAPGYDYSSALRTARTKWSSETLDRWLTDPRKFLPGARMPVRVLDPTTRRDIIAYLRRDSEQADKRNTSVAQHVPR